MRWSPVAKAGGRGVQNSTHAHPMGSDKNENENDGRPPAEGFRAPVLHAGGGAGGGTRHRRVRRRRGGRGLASARARTSGGVVRDDQRGGHDGRRAQDGALAGRGGGGHGERADPPHRVRGPEGPGRARGRLSPPRFCAARAGCCSRATGAASRTSSPDARLIVGRMLAEARAEAAAGGERMHEGQSLEFALLLNANAAAEAEKHVALYVDKGRARTRASRGRRARRGVAQARDGRRAGGQPRGARETAGSARWRRR